MNNFKIYDSFKYDNEKVIEAFKELFNDVNFKIAMNFLIVGNNKVLLDNLNNDEVINEITFRRILIDKLEEIKKNIKD